MLIAPDYGCKRRSTNRKALHAYIQPEGIGYLVRAVFLWTVDFWNKIWPSKQPKAMNDTLDRQFVTYSMARWSGLLQTSFGFWEIARCPVNCTHLTTFRLCKITTTNDIQKMVPSGPALSIVQLVTRSLRIHRYWTLFLVPKKKGDLTALIASVQSPWRVICVHVHWTLWTNYIP